jgi:hypothetical protein
VSLRRPRDIVDCGDTRTEPTRRGRAPSNSQARASGNRYEPPDDAFAHWAHNVLTARWLGQQCAKVPLGSGDCHLMKPSPRQAAMSNSTWKGLAAARRLRAFSPPPSPAPGAAPARGAAGNDA